jgi:23S rRNA m(6)A-1618 methyltransferase (EC 2.1.1.48)
LLDIGTGANGIYPLLASQIYGWHCVGSDINTQSLESVASIISRNAKLKGGFELRLQSDKNHIFDGIIRPASSLMSAYAIRLFTHLNLKQPRGA